MDGNIFEHSWADGQEGWAIRIVLGSDRYAAISDITFTNNIVRHAANGFDVCGNCSTASSVVNRVSVRNNLFTDISQTRWSFVSGVGWALMLRSGARDLTVDDNTFDQTGTFLVMTGASGSGLVIRDNIGNHGAFGIFGDGGFTGTAGLDRYFPGWMVQNNVLAATPGGNQSLYPSGTLFPSSMDAVGFVDRAGGNYRLSASSPFKNAGTDGTDLGVDFDVLEAAQASSSSIPPQTDTDPPAPPKNLKIMP